jgi:hypothetical protein
MEDEKLKSSYEMISVPIIGTIGLLWYLIG